MTLTASKLTLGPVLYNWQAEKKRDFYYKIADEAPIDTIYLGEIVCSKRSPFFAPYLPEIIERLERAGKQVVLSSMSLVMSPRERRELEELSEDCAWPVEANDVSIVNLLAGKPFMIGPFINVYSEGTLAYFYDQGATRIALPAELPASSISTLAGAAGGREVEVQVFGRLPLALSARCYHARSHNLSKDGCQYVCENDPDGMEVTTLDGTPFLCVNGTQTMSYTVSTLLAELNTLKQAGVSHFRLWPQDVDMVAVANLYRAVLDGREEAGGAEAHLQQLVAFAPFANGFYHSVEGMRMVR